jgi:hypothetical protein
MLQLNAAAFYKAVSTLSHARGAVYVHTLRESPGLHQPMKNFQQDEALANLNELQGQLIIMDAEVARIALDELLAKLEQPVSHKELGDELSIIDETLRRELSLKKIFVLERGNAKYFDPVEPIFGKEVQAQFSSSLFEIDEAGKCLALSRPTASVFHLMRIMEIGIRAITKCLGILDTVKPAERNWAIILRKIKEAMDARNVSGWTNADDKETFSGFYASLDAVKVAWRNPTMHVENKYTEEEAQHVFDVVRGFMNVIASRMDENGLPVA